MKKLAWSILLGLVTTTSYAQSSWSIENKNLNAGIRIQSSDGSLNINYLKKEERNQLLLISKKDMNCLICTMQFNFNQRLNNVDIEYLYKNSNNEFVYAVLNKVMTLKNFSYNSRFNLINSKTGTVYEFNGNVPINFFNSSDFSEWQNRNEKYETDSLNYYIGKNNIMIYATLGENTRISSLKTITFNGINLNCNPNCDMVTYFSAGQATYKIIREDNLGKITYRLPETFIKDMKTYNKDKDSFAIKIKTIDRGDMLFKFDSSSYAPVIY